jgi:hypothetical protein
MSLTFSSPVVAAEDIVDGLGVSLRFTSYVGRKDNSVDIRGRYSRTHLI